MRNYFLGSLIIILVIIGCDKVDEWTKFNIGYETTFQVPSSTIVDIPIAVSTPEVQTNASSKFSNNNTKVDLIEEIILNHMSLEVIYPSDENFSFLKDIEISITAEGLDTTRIAWMNDIPNDAGDSLSLNTSEEDLQAYIKASSYSLEISTTTDEVIATDYQISVFSQFLVDAKVLGQ